MKRIVLPAPAKINLALKVINKRPDGYHNLVTIFQKINLRDEIALTLNPSGRIRVFCCSPDVPKSKKNLVVQVAQLLKTRYKISKGVDIEIMKRIPVAAGLAGGSSNAASTLKGLNRLWGLDLPEKTLREYASIIGSDVPLFLYNNSWALGTSRGDQIKALNIPQKYWYVLVVPRIKIYSREVFMRFKLQLTKKFDNVNILLQSLRSRDLQRAGELFFNDLESSILTICPRLSKLKDKLKTHHLKGVGISGSGPAVFGIAESKNQAEAVKEILGRRYKNVFVVRTL